MGVILTYHLNSGFLHTLASGKSLYLPTAQEPSRAVNLNRMWKSRSGHLLHWDHLFEFPPGHAGDGASISALRSPATDLLCFKQESLISLGVYEFPGRYAQRFEDADPGAQAIWHPHRGMAIYIDDRSGGLYLHSWPPCNQPQCIVVMQRWEEVFEEIRRQSELAFSIAR